MAPYLPLYEITRAFKEHPENIVRVTATLGSVPVLLAARVWVGRGERTVSFAGTELGGLQEDPGKMFTLQKGHTPAQRQGEGLILRSNAGEGCSVSI